MSEGTDPQDALKVKTGGWVLSAQSWPSGGCCWKWGPKSPGAGVLAEPIRFWVEEPLPGGSAPGLAGAALSAAFPPAPQWGWECGSQAWLTPRDVWGESLGGGCVLGWPLASSSHPAPVALTDDCRGQAGCLGAGLRAGFPARPRPLGILCAGVTTHPAPPSSGAWGLPGQVQG